MKKQQIEARIIADSIGPNKVRIITFILTYPRFIHSEFLTHRVFSRNASSSRAIPVKKQIKMVLDNPAIPLSFQANKPGMQAGDSFGPLKQWICRKIWMGACYASVFFATLMEKFNIHKQYANRILEPFSHITVVCTATKRKNFYKLRNHNDAQPEIRELARKMLEAEEQSIPIELKEGEWHLPFVKYNDWVVLDDAIKHSVARCARTSYLTHEGKETTLEKDRSLYNKLVVSEPLHASPSEHQAMALKDFPGPEVTGNFHGWAQYRKTLKGENGDE